MLKSITKDETWNGAREADWATLERQWARKGSEGSNPSRSANKYGNVAERLKALVLKTRGGESHPWVRILPFPPIPNQVIKMKRIGVAGLIMSGGKHCEHILLGRRGKDPNRGLYVLPGGGVKDGESLEQAFQREILEETGLQIEPTKGYSRWENPHVIELLDRLILVAKAEVLLKKGSDDDSPRDGSDLYDVEWFDVEGLPPDISPVVMPIIKLRGFRQRRVYQ